MIVNRAERHYIKKAHKNFKVVDDLCFQSKNVYNYANYLIRQKFVETGEIIKRFDMQVIMKDTDCYKALGSNTGQVTIQMLDRNWKSFFTAIKDWSENPSKYYAKPKIPRYLNKNGRYVVGITNNKFKIVDGYIRFSWKKLYCMNNTFKTRIPDSAKLMQVRFIPKGNCYVMEVCYQIEVPNCFADLKRVAAIDLGVENFITMANNIGEKPIVIKGGVIKSINQYYNKKKSKLQSELKKCNGKDWSNALQKLTNKRYEMIKYQMHCISKYLVDYCVLHNIDTLIVGRNKDWKQENTRKQNFTYIPYELFQNMLKYKCENNGIKYIEVVESYTSGTSFLDNEEPCKEFYNKKRRIYRGLFISNQGIAINADVNAAYQIMKKVIPEANADGIEGVYLHPTIIKKLVA